MTPLAAALMVFSMEMVSAFISVLIGYYASKAHRASSARGLQFLYLGFAILGIGIFLRAITAIYLLIAFRVADAVSSSLAGISNLAGIIFTLTQLVAYSLFVATYAYQQRGQGEWGSKEGSTTAMAVFPIARLFYIPTLELVAIAMLGFVAFSSLVNWRHRQATNSALVFSGFSLMFLSHILYLFMILSENLLFYGQLTQLAGFVCLLIMLVRVNGDNAKRA